VLAIIAIDGDDERVMINVLGRLATTLIGTATGDAQVLGKTTTGGIVAHEVFGT
jgi:hypothetical protein